jgi:hypothetical protein
LVSLDDVELLDGLSHTMACELAGACQVGEASLKAAAALWGKSRSTSRTGILLSMNHEGLLKPFYILGSI